MAKESLSGVTKAPTMVISSKTISTVWASTSGLMEESLREIGSIIEWKDEESSHGAMAVSM